jgi:hypothetical protein
VAVGGWLTYLTVSGQLTLAACDTRLVFAGLEAAGGDDLLPIPDPDGEGVLFSITVEGGPRK